MANCIISYKRASVVFPSLLLKESFILALMLPIVLYFRVYNLSRRGFILMASG